MRNNKNNITSGLENIISFSRNITSHFTGKAKIITLVSAIIILSSVNIINTSALSYQSNVGIGFTFNPTLSVSISPSNLVIDNLTPSITADSNAITVSVATNAAYGYTLSATVNGGNNSNNSNLTHTNGTSIFSSIATDASLSILTNDNTWGYSYRLSNNSNNNAWSNYSGLSNETSKTLVNTDNQAAKPIDFKIAAKAAETQPSGAYTGVINFAAVTNPTPMNLSESYFAAGKTRHNGYYAMQDMTTEICNNTEVTGEDSQTQLIDLRDDKIYWATKLEDGHCWMTQNLDLDLDSSKTYTHWDTDLGWSSPDNLDTSASWRPERNTIAFSGDSVLGWNASRVYPYSANPGDVYYHASGTSDDDVKYNSLQECENAGHNDCTHYHAGNYYNWPATIANNDISGFSSGEIAPNSICPSNWRIANANDNEVGKMLYLQGVISSPTSTAYSGQGFNMLRSAPLYFVRSGKVDYVVEALRIGWYWNNGVKKEDIYLYARYFSFNSTRPMLSDFYGTQLGFSVRCLAR